MRPLPVKGEVAGYQHRARERIQRLIIGTAMGASLAGRINERWFRRLVTALLITTALTALVTAILG